MTKFWKPLGRDLGAQWWGRCDMCYWSGPAEKFHTITKYPAELGDVCNHVWCWNPLQWEYYRQNGWHVISGEF
jgi:hypothetical protein